MLDITKHFPGIIANNRVHFDLRAGEVHALLGENGAGKSTLMSILTGLYRPDEGEIRLRGRRVAFRSPRDAIAAGIGMVHQHFKLVSSFTVTENILLGQNEPGLWLHGEETERRVKDISARYGLQVDPSARIWQLSVGEQQRVEIVKMLYLGADVLILDEPTAVLTPQEADELFRALKEMAARGHGVVIITHKLREAMAVADRVTVLRGGVNVGTLSAAEADEGTLARMMVGREVMGRVEKAPYNPGPPVLEVRNLHVIGDRGLPAVRGVDLEVRVGEILGIAGVAGNGQRELAEALAGLRRPTDGRIVIDGHDCTGRSPRAAMAAGLSLIPEDRLGMGLVPNLDLPDNVILKDYRRPPIARGWFVDRRAAVERTRRIVKEFDVRAADIGIPVKLLSGGNAQKLLLGRELSNRPRVLVAMFPVRGLDVGAIEAVHTILCRERDGGTGVLLISEDLDELLKLADRIAVLYEGRVMGIVDAATADVQTIGLMMAGQEVMAG